ncbi:MAG: hypothetical protein KJ666_12765 [Bacteroidetes bacterium]|nr:hypothetical protein [Bacteroidota bacterium]
MTYFFFGLKPVLLLFVLEPQLKSWGYKSINFEYYLTILIPTCRDSTTSNKISNLIDETITLTPTFSEAIGIATPTTKWTATRRRRALKPQVVTS